MIFPQATSGLICPMSLQYLTQWFGSYYGELPLYGPLAKYFVWFFFLVYFFPGVYMFQPPYHKLSCIINMMASERNMTQNLGKMACNKKINYYTLQEKSHLCFQQVCEDCWEHICIIIQGLFWLFKNTPQRYCTLCWWHPTFCKYFSQ